MCKVVRPDLLSVCTMYHTPVFQIDTARNIKHCLINSLFVAGISLNFGICCLSLILLLEESGLLLADTILALGVAESSAVVSAQV